MTVSEVTGSSNGGGVDVETMLSLSRVLKFTTIIVILQAIVLTCLSTLAAFLYNASSGLVGGVEITLTESEWVLGWARRSRLVSCIGRRAYSSVG